MTLVRMDQTACCALVHAFLRNRDVLARWANGLGSRFEVLAGIFSNTRRIEFSPTLEMSAMYRDFAATELKKLANTRPLLCSHTTAEHRTALWELLKQLPKAH